MFCAGVATDTLHFTLELIMCPAVIDASRSHHSIPIQLQLRADKASNVCTLTLTAPRPGPWLTTA